VVQINQATNINVGDNYKLMQKLKQRERRKKTRENLFTQFGPILAYSRGESSSSFHNNDELLYKEVSKGYKNKSSNLILLKVPNFFL
jgi:hypothetical protein